MYEFHIVIMLVEPFCSPLMSSCALVDLIYYQIWMVFAIGSKFQPFASLNLNKFVISLKIV